MKKRALCALVSLALCVTLAGQAAAAESSVSFVVNGITLAADVPNRVEARTTYVSYWPIVSALYPNATAEWVNGQAEVKADGLTLHIKPGAQYVEANGRYLYVPDGVKCEGYSIMVPIRTLCQALGAGVEWDGTLLKTQEVQHGGDAEAPADPTRVGYTFTGWDKEFTNIMADLVVTARYEINTYTVTFKDWDGTVLKTQEVQYGGDAEAPADPTRVGYTFTGWDKAFTNITADLVVTAQYEMLGDVDGDGNVSMADALTILRMAMDILPVENQQIADVDGDGFITSMDALLALRFAMHIEQ